jgi:biopolymer transport protein ExbD
MKPALKQKIKNFFSALAALFGAILLLTLKSKQQQKEAAEKDALSAAENAAQKAKEKKEIELEKTDSITLLDKSVNSERNSTKLTTLEEDYKSRVRTRLREKLQ